MPKHEKFKVLNQLFDKIVDKQKELIKQFSDKDGDFVSGFIHGCIMAKEQIIELEEKVLKEKKWKKQKRLVKLLKF